MGNGFSKSVERPHIFIADPTERGRRRNRELPLPAVRELKTVDRLPVHELVQ
jgi:hypothetical protein